MGGLGVEIRACLKDKLEGAVDEASSGRTGGVTGDLGCPDTTTEHYCAKEGAEQRGTTFSLCFRKPPDPCRKRN